jgi:hypothetical protein
MGHASIRVTKDVYGHLVPKARAKAAEAMRSVLYDEVVPNRPHESDPLATQTATLRVANSYSKPLMRTFVGFCGPPGSRSRHLGIKRNLPSVVLCRFRCACPLFSRKRVVLCRSRRVVLQKYEAQNEAYSDLSVRILLCEFQDRIASVGVQVRVGPTLHSEPSGSCRLTAPISVWRLRASPRVGRSRARPASGR